MMTPSTQTDPKTNEAYPDVLVVDYSSFEFSEPAIEYAPDSRMADRPWIVTNALYGEAAYEDIVMMVNNIPHLSKLYDYSSVKLPVKNDLIAFMKRSL